MGAALHAADSNVIIPIDTLAGTSGYLPILEDVTCSLVIAYSGNPPNGMPASRVVVGPSRFAPNNDGRTFQYTKLASDTPYGGVYNLQVVADFTNGLIRTSNIGSLTVLCDL